MSLDWHELFGLVGVLLVLSMFGCAQFGKLQVQGYVYPACNALGAAFILVSLYHDFNLAAFAIESAWLLVSIAGLIHHYLRSIRLKR